MNAPETLPCMASGGVGSMLVFWVATHTDLAGVLMVHGTPPPALPSWARNFALGNESRAFMQVKWSSAAAPGIAPASRSAQASGAARTERHRMMLVNMAHRSERAACHARWGAAWNAAAVGIATRRARG